MLVFQFRFENLSVLHSLFDFCLCDTLKLWMVCEFSLFYIKNDKNKQLYVCMYVYIYLYIYFVTKSM